MKTKTGRFALRLPLSLKAAAQKFCAQDGTSLNQFLVVAAREKKGGTTDEHR
jgi:predicted HicB family RNase H-like nuclease